MGRDTCLMYVIWDGVWVNVSGNKTFTGTETNHVKLNLNVSYSELLEKAYELTSLNHDEFDIEMTWWEKYDSKSLVVPVRNDDDVETLVSFNTESRCSIPLCLVFKKKEMEMPKEPKESHNSNIPGAGQAGLGSTEQRGIGSATKNGVGTTVQSGKESTEQSVEESTDQSVEESAEEAGIGSTEQAVIGSTEQAGIGSTEQAGIGNP
ncbi:hypothetical protein CASFOL_026175 [Castilleja foliolosa]|uniref:PB1 domain-containing protein n=1 Tax=Castilleja foliolosa TaxID=1961234 RepID=A0ABD3CIV7_9LAMI